MQKRPVKSSNRLVTPKKRRRNIDPATRQLVLQVIGGTALIAFVLLLLTGIWYGSRVSALTIDTITVEGGQTISHTQVKEAVASTLEGNYFGLIPKRFAWTYPQETAMVAVAGISRVKNPIIERVSGTELRVIIDEYIPFALWCMEDNPGCYFVDREGTAFALSPVLDGGSMYRFFSLGSEPARNEQLRDRQTLSEIITIAEALESNFNLPVSKIELDTVGDVFFHVVGGGEIKTTTAQPAKDIIDNLRLVLSADDFKTLTAGTFLYIDLRFGNKVFVNDTIPTQIATVDMEDINSIAGEEGVNILSAIVAETVAELEDDSEEEMETESVIDTPARTSTSTDDTE